MSKVMVDTSVFIAGLLTKNPNSGSATVISMWRAQAFTLVVSPQILREYVAKLYDKGFDEGTVVQFVALIGKIALHIPGAYESHRLDQIDKTDNKFLAAAYESGADYIVSGDKEHLLPLKHFHGTEIVSPELFIRAMICLVDEDREQEQFDAELDSELHALSKETFVRERKSAPTSTDT